MESETNTPSAPPADQQSTPITAIPAHNKSPIAQWLFVFALIGVTSFFGYQNWQLKKEVLNLKTAQQAQPTPSGTDDALASWKSYTDPVLGISYKLPPKLARVDLSGKETAAEQGTQYCMIYQGSLSLFRIPKAVAGVGPCGGGVFGIGTVSKDYVAGREGGFGDFTGYVKQNNAYFLRFVNTISQTPLPKGVAIEHTNTNGVTYLRITGKNTMHDVGDEYMNGPMLGTPGEGYLGAIIHISHAAYTGFNIQMQINSPNDEMVFDQILSTIKFTKTTSTGNEPATQTTMDNWQTYTNSTPAYAIQYPTDWTIDTSKAKQNDETGAQLIIRKGLYALTITWPTGYGPSVCVFSDNPLYGKEKEGPIGDCVGTFVEFSSTSQVFRRLAKPDLIPRENPTSASWSIYTKDKSGSFVTVPPIGYAAPKIYDENTIRIMDQILSSFKAVN